MSRPILAALAAGTVAAVVACSGAKAPGDLFEEAPSEVATDRGGGAGGRGPASAATPNEPGPVPPTGCDVSFGRDILPLMGASCANGACHGFAVEPRIDPTRPDATYASLLAYEIDDLPYVDPTSDDPDDSAMHCHLRQDCGEEMPLVGRMPEQLPRLAKTWLECGAPLN